MLEGDPPAIVDAAHNEAGARALAEALPALAAGRPVVACLAVLADKDAAAIAAALAPALDGCVCTAADPGPAMGRPGSRALAAAELARLRRGGGDRRRGRSRSGSRREPDVGAGARAGRGGALRRFALPSQVRMDARHAQNCSR